MPKFFALSLNYTGESEGPAKNIDLWSEDSDDAPSSNYTINSITSIFKSKDSDCTPKFNTRLKNRIKQLEPESFIGTDVDENYYEKLRNRTLRLTNSAQYFTVLIQLEEKNGGYSVTEFASSYGGVYQPDEDIIFNKIDIDVTLASADDGLSFD